MVELYQDPTVSMLFWVLIFVFSIRTLFKWHTKRFPPMDPNLMTPELKEMERRARDRSDREFENRERGIIRDTLSQIERNSRNKW